jgi:hypothetical protein
VIQSERADPGRQLDASKQRYARRPPAAPWPTWSTAPTSSWAARPPAC